MSDPQAGPSSKAPFPTTRWSRVIAAAGPGNQGASEALAELCRGYWYPLYAFVRRKGYAPDRAADLTQEYFARLLGSDVLARADRHQGRFRAFLRADCGFFLSHQAERDRALKRGGGATPLSIDARDAEGRYLREPVDETTPERLFDQAWAVDLLDGVLRQLAREYADSGRTALFERLQGTLGSGGPPVPYAEHARQLGTTEGAIQQAVQRLRRRYRSIVREHIAATLHDPDETAIDDEIRDLFASLGS